MGHLDNCVNNTFVPQWNSENLTIRQQPPPLPRARRATDVFNKLKSYKQRRGELPFYFCLGWRPNIQQPTILYMSHLRISRQSIRCHVLSLHGPTPNNFAHCLSELPRNLCQNTAERCACANKHAENFPLENILEVAVYTENRTVKNHFQRVRGQPQRQDFELFDLPPNKRNDLLFTSYATKRLEFFNDFFTV
jgi:hypothetical protein